ncbi:MAG: glycosyltransferase family 2 protein [Candidatus Omnitrophica bacterium]|nr:glycosyltransferase family 2 protein [Candidatus Omnitrophota bacterium]
MSKVPVSVVIITKNEEANISDCLKSASWADEIVVLDDYSTDNTVNLARQYTDKIFSRKTDIEGRHRNYAYGLAKNAWVLSLDVDECVTSELAAEIRSVLNGAPKDKVFTIPIKTYIGKRWIEHGGWYPAGKTRLFDKRTFKYEEADVHPRVFYEGTCGHLKKDIIHYSYKDYHDYFISLNNQTTLEAKKWFDEKRKIGFLKMSRKLLSRFLKSYVQKQGYKDGLLGFMIAYGSGLYQLMSYVKYREMVDNQK